MTDSSEHTHGNFATRDRSLTLRHALLPLVVSLAAVLMSFCNPVESPPAVTAEPIAASDTTSAQPVPRLLWSDGSTLVFDGNTWIAQSQVSYYQFSLCIEAGACMPGEDERLEVGQALLDPELAGMPMPDEDAQIVQPNCAQEYCTWAGGRPATAEEDAWIRIDNGSPAPFSPIGFRCAVDNPSPYPAYCQSSAFYESGLPEEEMEATATKAGEFCQGGKGFVSFDLEIPADATILGFTSADCEQAGGNRIACSGAPGTSLEAWVSIQCNDTPAFGCSAGYELSAEQPAACRYERAASSVPSVQAVSLQLKPAWYQIEVPECPRGTTLSADQTVCIMPATPPNPALLCPPGYSLSFEQTSCIPAGPQLHCPGGYSLDSSRSLCLPANRSNPQLCPDGYTLNSDQTSCIPLAPGDVPYCPPGSTLNVDQTACILPATPLNSTLLCPPGYSLHFEQTTCVAAGRRPGAPTCPGGYTLSADRTVCLVDTPTRPRLCPDGYTLNSARTFCVPLPTGDVPYCPPGSTLNVDQTACILPATPPSPTLICPPGYSLHFEQTTCVPAGPRGGSPPCPTEYVYDIRQLSCIADATGSDQNCMGGFEYDPADQCCMSTLETDRYPGCPPGTAVNPATGTCDLEHVWATNTTMLETIELSMTFPSCSNGDGGGGGGGCSSHGDENSCAKAGCKWDAIKKTCG